MRCFGCERARHLPQITFWVGSIYYQGHQLRYIRYFIYQEPLKNIIANGPSCQFSILLKKCPQQIGEITGAVNASVDYWEKTFDCFQRPNNCLLLVSRELGF